MKHSLFSFMRGVITLIRQNGRLRTAETYKAALNSFRTFRNGKDISLNKLTTEVMEAYEAWHKEKGNSLNTISFYIRILRAVYRRAVEEELIEDRKPFRHVYTGVGKTNKRALPISAISEIKALDLSDKPRLDYARDMFMMSFMLRGMSFVDMAYLRKSDLATGYITYRRRKTGRQLRVKWTEEMQAILDKYEENSSGYLLPIIRRNGVNEHKAYKNVGYNINYALRSVGNMIGTLCPLTMYVARHSWASAAQAKGIPVSVISEGMGHDSESTTRIYLANLDTSVIDSANSLILKCI